MVRINLNVSIICFCCFHLFAVKISDIDIFAFTTGKYITEKEKIVYFLARDEGILSDTVLDRKTIGLLLSFFHQRHHQHRFRSPSSEFHAVKCVETQLKHKRNDTLV